MGRIEYENKKYNKNHNSYSNRISYCWVTIIYDC